MIEEIFKLEVAPGTGDAFEKDYQKVVHLLETAEGYRGTELKRSLENENIYLISVSWKTIEAHTEDFKASLEYEKMKELLAPHYLEIPEFMHFKKIN